MTDDPCGAWTILWPEEEALDVHCALPRGHNPANIHKDDLDFEWDADELVTWERDPSG